MKIIRHSIILAAAALLVACGGSSSGSFQTGGSARMSIAVESSQVPTNSSIEVTVSFRAADGSAVADGTQVTLNSSNTSRGVVSAFDGEQSGASATTTTSGGQASFRFTARANTGTVTLTASGPNPGGSGTVSATRDIEVVAGGPEGISIEVETDEVPTNSSAQVTVHLRDVDGAPVADGTEVSLVSSNISRGVVAAAAGGASGPSATAQTSAGQAVFIFTARAQTGTVTLTASGPDSSGSGSVSATRDIHVIEDPDGQARLEISGSNTMPANKEGVGIFLGSPFITELTIRYRNPDGSAGSVTGGQIAVAVSPVNLGAFSTLDDPATDDVNEFYELKGASPVNMAAGVATIFVHSFDKPGMLTVSVSAQDANTDDTFSRDFVIEIIDGAADFLPASLSFSASTDPVYTTGSGGKTTKNLTLFVNDSAGNAVPDPEGSGAQYNNVLLTLDAPQDSGARLTGTGKAGSVSGSEIAVQTVNGVASFSLNAGSEIGTHRITATVDRADNNVDNDLLDPLSAGTTVNVGDGQIFAVRLVSPSVNRIRVNSTTGSIESSVDPVTDPETGAQIPPNPDGTYSLTVTAIATDRMGNPPLVGGQPLSLGKIDSPLTAAPAWQFPFSGHQGNPEEGGRLFTVGDDIPGFLDSPGGPNEAAEPGDTLALMGKRVPGNRQHEAVRVVGSVIDDTTLQVTQPFNLNDGTGAIVDHGEVIPWVLGRSEVGSIDAQLSLNERGIGSVRLTYPINSIGRPVVLWTQGERQTVGNTLTVGDVEPVVFPGLAPALLTASPGVIVGNDTTLVTLCLTDALRAPINGVTIHGSVTEGDAVVELDGTSAPAGSASPTGTNGPGCVVVEVAVSAVVPGGEPSILIFSHGEAEAPVQIVPRGSARLLVEPRWAIDTSPSARQQDLTLTLVDADGNPVSGVGLVAECDGGDGRMEMLVNPGVTDEHGQTDAMVIYAMAACGQDRGDPSFPRIGQCQFTTTSGTPVGLFTVEGVNLRIFDDLVSPSHPDGGYCPPLESSWTLNVTVEDHRATAQDSTVVSTPQGIECDASGTNDECFAEFSENTSTVLLRAPAGTSSPEWLGDCVEDTNSSDHAEVSGASDADRICVVVFK